MGVPERTVGVRKKDRRGTQKAVGERKSRTARGASHAQFADALREGGTGGGVELAGFPADAEA